jgi:hypothetical protein
VSADPPLYSEAYGYDDLDTGLAHSCDPNTEVVVESDCTVKLYATRDIEAGEPVSFDYNVTEQDTKSDGAMNFTCECGANNCRKEIEGYAHLPAYKGKAAAPVAAIQTFHAAAKMPRSAIPWEECDSAVCDLFSVVWFSCFKILLDTKKLRY